MKTIELQRKHGLTLADVETWRRALSRTFAFRRLQVVRDFRSRILRVEQLDDWVLQPNLVVNEGIDTCLDVHLSGATQITAWKVAVWKTNTTVLATHTYASPGYTECTTGNLDEATRQAWTDAGVSSHALTNAAAPAVYTGDDSHTIYGAAIVGGGSAASTLADAAGGGKMHASANFGSGKVMDVDVQLQITYILNNADDGV